MTVPVGLVGLVVVSTVVVVVVVVALALALEELMASDLGVGETDFTVDFDSAVAIGEIGLGWLLITYCLLSKGTKG
jgi:hypothetical protein